MTPKEIVDAVDSLLGHLVSWPVAVLTIALVFRTSLIELVVKLRRKYALATNEAEFGEGLRKAEERVDAATTDTAPPDTIDNSTAAESDPAEAREPKRTRPARS